MLLDVEPREVIACVGHDGSEIFWPELEEPRCRRGFHLQEIVDVLINDYLILPVLIEAEPLIDPDGDGVIHTFEAAADRFNCYLSQHKGILLGRSKANYTHAVAWDKERIYDPCGGRADGFQPDALLAFM